MTALEQFKEAGTRLAVIINEFGEAEGIVTLTDILEAIVGDIPLRGTLPEPRVDQLADGSWLVDGLEYIEAGSASLEVGVSTALEMLRKVLLDEHRISYEPWENGYIESFNGKMRDELLDREIFYTLREAQILIEDWRRKYNTIRPHSTLNYRPPAPEAMLVSPPPAIALNLT